MAICFFRNSKTGRRSWTLGNSSIRRSRSSSASSRMAIAGFAASSMVWVHDLERVWWHRVVDHYRQPVNRLALGTGKLLAKGLPLVTCLFGGDGQVIMRENGKVSGR